MTKQKTESKAKLKPIPESFNKWLQNTFIDVDKIDVESEYDRALTIDENKTIFHKKYLTLVKPVEQKLTKIEQKHKTIEATKELNTRAIESTLGLKINIYRE